ncbi:hypothetical protein L211DRAFT_104649 [Terfezia boudieri ATCC MYA-4762]|uniref:Uncharacterized protein n=1 Tax=Terfezia boudieri ATCC MYA-4762 TaxID=1051890 RepID=A0A3N4LQM4_9PEZI|nr:hypothetical protein L211DRAFT_104649 [Terfezia boudieri ATCC MYA-4762]
MISDGDSATRIVLFIGKVALCFPPIPGLCGGVVCRKNHKNLEQTTRPPRLGNHITYSQLSTGISCSSTRVLCQPDYKLRGHKVISRCIGFLDGTNMVLLDKLMVNPEAYFSPKKNYGLS